MMKYAGLLLAAVVAIILSSLYVVHVRSMGSNPSENLQFVVVRSLVEVPTSLLTVDQAAPTAVPSLVVGAPTALPITTALPTGILSTPTVLPTGVLAAPTAIPTDAVAAPTAMPTFPPLRLYCPAFSASNTNSATSNYAVCPIIACPGDTVTMTTFLPGSCNGDTYLRLYDPSTGSELASDDDYNGSACSQITYTFTASCRTYQLREGCYGSDSCGGRVYYTGSSAATPTVFPTLVVGAPTAIPGVPTTKPSTVFASPTTKPTVIFASPTTKPTVVFASPTLKPTLVPGAPTISPMVNGYYCPAFSTSNTNSATSNYAICPITACPGDTVLMTTFSPGSCNGDTYLRVYDPSTGAELTQNDQYGGTDCSQITYTFTASCRTYELREGCWRSFSCGGRVYYTGSSAISQSPIAIATTIPTINLAAPTAVPGTPTRKPTVVFASPTTKPTLVPGAPTISPMVNGYYCPEFSTSNTNYATSNYAVCPITACPGDIVTMTTLSPGSCNGDNYLRLYDPTTGSELTYNDDSNGSLCSQITYSFSASCRTYELREGCYSSGSCGGQVYYTGSSAISQSPIAIATTMPTGIIGSPTAFPTGTFGAPTQQNIPGSERDAMYDLYTSTNGNNWYSYGSRWDFSDPYSNPCIQGWHGVQCSSWYYGYYHVYELSLGYRNLIGTIPDSIVNLSYLRGLYLDYNLLYGTIPRSIGQLLSLYDLLLSNNYFTGVIPDSFGQQNSFGEFDVSNNYLEGSIPLSIFNIPYMNYLNVKGNRLTGSLSSNISSVNSLDVSGNNMVGIIPSSLCNSSILQEIYLYGNNFQCYPQCLKSNVRYAYVGNTPLCPPVPSTAPAAPTTLPTRVINVPSLLPTVVPGAPTRKPTVILGAPTTFPTGTFGAPTQQNIPESERDAVFDMYTSTNGHNWYSYGSPWDFSDPYSNPCTQYWQGLYCSFWYSDGYYHVYELSLTYRNLVGTIPDSIVNLSYLSNLYMDYNLLHGTIPRSIGQLSSLYDLLLSNNYLTGVIPDSFGQQNYFGEFDVSNNYLEGSIPLSIFNIPYLWSLKVKGNLLTGSLPDLIVNLYISRLDVSGNNMVGIIPSSLCASDYLQEIYLYGNDFQCYPQCLTSNLRYAYVGNTPLCPPVPSTAPAAPTALPTFPSNGYYCPAFSTSNTNSATSNYAICPITACPGDTVLMTTFSPGSCNGDTYLRLYDPSTGAELTQNDQYGDTDCSQITYTFTASCRTYELREGCWRSYSCEGQVYYTGSSAISQSPIAIATTIPSTQAPHSVNPSIRPTRKPTARPSSRSPTSKLTPKPSFRPTIHPTNTRKPSSRAPVKPTLVPSRHRATITPTTGSPTVKPTRISSRRQSNPSLRPTSYPTTSPTSTRKPTSRPSVKPTRVPSRRQTTTAPTTRSPMVKPTRIPSRRPSRAPSV